LDDVGSGAALSRASSASLGMSFSFTGFTMPPDEIADSRPFSDDDIQAKGSILTPCNVGGLILSLVELELASLP
nr:ABC transporter G family member 22 isoform X1 [Tanacetum cinerariifolium]